MRVSILILPFLAIPFAVGSRRSQRGLRTVFALALIVIYHEIIQQGANIAGKGTVSHWLTLWLPCALLAPVCRLALLRRLLHCLRRSASALPWTGSATASTACAPGCMRRFGWEQPA